MAAWPRPPQNLNMREVQAPHCAEAARQLMQGRASSFYAASRWLAQPTRGQVERLYALARVADDLADEPSLGQHESRYAALGVMHAESHLPAADGTPTQQVAWELLHSGGAKSLALQALPKLLHSLRGDMSMAQPIGSLTELLTYAYGVAGTVGLMLRPLLGASPKADEFALAMGMAMQLTNVARDVAEDGARGRRYVPASSGDGLVEVKPADVAQVLDLAEILYAYAAKGLMLIAQPNRRAIRVAMLLYREIGRSVRREMALGQVPTHRVRVSALRKAWVLSRGLALGRMNDWMAVRTWNLPRLVQARAQALEAVSQCLARRANA